MVSLASSNGMENVLIFDFHCVQSDNQTTIIHVSLHYIYSNSSSVRNDCVANIEKRLSDVLCRHIWCSLKLYDLNISMRAIVKPPIQTTNIVLLRRKGGSRWNEHLLLSGHCLSFCLMWHVTHSLRLVLIQVGRYFVATFKRIFN